VLEFKFVFEFGWLVVFQKKNKTHFLFPLLSLGSGPFSFLAQVLEVRRCPSYFFPAAAANPRSPVA
jgi:hypothetical protein